MPPIFDDYGDENNNDSYFVEIVPITINKNDHAYVGSSNYFMHETDTRTARDCWEPQEEGVMRTAASFPSV